MLFSNDLTEELYKQILLKHLQFLRPIEETLQSTNWNSFKFDIKEHLRVPRLQQDLTNLNVSPDTIANLPVFEFLPQMRTLAQSLGVLYVAEGSMMGGKVIVKKIDNVEHGSMREQMIISACETFLFWEKCLNTTN
jgi:heme oxygenase